MEIKTGTKIIAKGTKTSIIDVDLGNGYTIYVFQGNLSRNDILIKFKSPFSNRIRTPQHIHWAVDLLIKYFHSKRVTADFIQDIQRFWVACSPLTANDKETLSQLINSALANIDLDKYAILNLAGEYLIEFLVILMCLLAVQEKTNATSQGKTAHMFGDVLNEFQKSQIDIFKIMQTAGFGGR